MSADPVLRLVLLLPLVRMLVLLMSGLPMFGLLTSGLLWRGGAAWLFVLRAGGLLRLTDLLRFSFGVVLRLLLRSGLPVGLR